MTWLNKALIWLLVGVLLPIAAIWSWYSGINPYWGIMGLIFAGFSLFRSYKAFIEVWRNRLSKKAEIEIVAEKDTYLPGEIVNLSVKVTGEEELDIEEGRVALVCANRYLYQYQTTDSDNTQTYRTKEATDEVVAGDERILEEKTILPGSSSGHELALDVPQTAAPSASGEITNVEWKVRVTLVVRGAPDVIKELPLTILSTSDSYASWAESDPYLDLHDLCNLEFRVPRRTFRPGERVEGTLVLTPHQDFNARPLSVELVRAEVVSRGSGNFSETVEASEVVDESPRYQAGSVREYDFAMDVPQGAGPCLETDQTYAAWRLKAVLRRRLGFDPELQLLLNVYNDPRQRPGTDATAAHRPLEEKHLRDADSKA